MASGKHGCVDSLLMIRHGKLVYDRSYKHDYGQIYAQEAQKPGPIVFRDYDLVVVSQVETLSPKSHSLSWKRRLNLFSGLLAKESRAGSKG